MRATTPMPPRTPAVAPVARSMDPRMRQRRAAVRRDEGRRRLRVLLGMVSTMVVVMVALLLAHSPWLSVSRISVVGAHDTSSVEIRRAVAPVLHHSMISVGTGSVEARLDALPWVEAVAVRRSWPSTLVVSIRERVAVAQVADGARWARVDAGGRVLAVTAQPTPGEVVLVSPAPPGPPGTRLPAAEAGPLAVAAALPPDVAGQVTSVSAPADGAVSLRTGAGATVDLGPPTALETKLSALRTVLTEVDMTGVRLIDLRVPGQPALTRA